MQILKVQGDLESFRAQGSNIAFIPTMGALHAGHLALVEEGLRQADRVIVSIFVNPTQFAPHEDFSSYPRTQEADIEKLEAVGAQAVWLPAEEDIYPDGRAADIKAGDLAKPLEGEFRPHFFDGVVSVVSRLFDAVQPDIAIFGEKDFQQLQVIRHMVKAQGKNIDIIGAPIVRDENGLALSSRNAYLSSDEYKIAISLNKILYRLACGDLMENQAHEKLLSAGFDKVDYCTARNGQTFLPVNPNRVLAAAWLGKTRLIDNMAIEDK